MEGAGSYLATVSRAVEQATGLPLGEGALRGVRVVDLSWVGVGPLTTLYLAHHGAQVFRVESTTRIDLVRYHGPYRDQVVNVNASGMFEDNNTNKLGVTLNLSHPKGIELVKRLVSQADVVAESFTPKAMKKWGLTYDGLRQIRPDIIMISLTSMGQFGPHCLHPGAGVTLPGLAGLYHLTGYPDKGPAEIGMPYTDWVVPHVAATALMTALDFRMRTGRGQYIDVSQLETAIHALETAVLDYTFNGRSQGRVGNRHPYFAPHGVFRCKGWERWVAIAVTTDAEWGALCKALGHPHWAEDPRFATFRGRHRYQDEIEGHINDWTSQRTAEQAMATLQAAGVPCGVVANGQDLHEDPQLDHRHLYWYPEHPEMGKVAHGSSPFILSETPRQVYSASPIMGQHNELILREYLGLNDEELVELVQESALD